MLRRRAKTGATAALALRRLRQRVDRHGVVTCTFAGSIFQVRLQIGHDAPIRICASRHSLSSAGGNRHRSGSRRNFPNVVEKPQTFNAPHYKQALSHSTAVQFEEGPMRLSVILLAATMLSTGSAMAADLAPRAVEPVAPAYLP